MPERSCSAWQIIRLALGEEFPWADVVVGLTPDTEHCRASTELFASTELVAASRCITLSIPDELADKPLQQADPRTAAMCERQCLDLLDRRRRRGVAVMLRAPLFDPSATPTMDLAAQQLCGDPHVAVSEQAVGERQLAQTPRGVSEAGRACGRGRCL